ncbi:hypothetical protein [Micromonospora sp. NPDC049204]|uniref:hypothetical protein n=1 Tax=Micromonospora sp. NPDC049204 TaxID=3154351 RepID=UPI0033E0BB7A
MVGLLMAVPAFGVEDPIGGTAGLYPGGPPPERLLRADATVTDRGIDTVASLAQSPGTPAALRWRDETEVHVDSPYEPFDPFAEDPEGDFIVDDYLRSKGWSEFFGIGGDNAVMSIHSWTRTVDDQQEFLLSVNDLAQGSPFLKVRSFPDLMDLLARWSPVVQAANVVSLLEDVNTHWLSGDGFIERIAAKASYGAEIVRPQMQADLSRRRERASAQREMLRQQRAQAN